MNFSEIVVSLHQKKKQRQLQEHPKNKRYETNDIILIDGFDDHSSFRS